jgi:hypothetical protein
MTRCAWSNARALSCVLAAASLVASLAAQAAQPTTTDVEKLIKRANELRTANKDQEALPLYQKAYEVAPTPRTAAQLGLCELSLGYFLAADGHLSQALAGRSDWIDRNRATLESSLRHSRKQIGEVVVSGSPDGASVSINGNKVGSLPLASVRVTAGQIRVEVSAPGYVDKSKTVLVVGERQERVTLQLEREGAAIEPPRASSEPSAKPAGGLGQGRMPPGRPDESSSWGMGKLAGVILVGVGVAAIATGALALRNVGADCVAPAGATCNLGSRSKVPGWTLIGAGAAAGIAGGMMFAVSGAHEEPARHAFTLSIRGAF